MQLTVVALGLWQHIIERSYFIWNGAQAPRGGYRGYAFEEIPRFMSEFGRIARDMELAMLPYEEEP
ncbi:MAG: hypothetical protein OHK0050_36300 [Roseiflexaceae bacterium]